MKTENNYAANQASQYPDRLVALCSVNPQEIERCSNIMGLKLNLYLSGITNISKEQLKEHAIMLDGPGSKIINEEEQPLWVLNDKVISSEFLKRIKPKHIDSISVLKGDVAIEYYGKDGKNGVVKIYANRKIFTDLEPDTTNEVTN